MKYKAGDIVTCINIVDFRKADKPKMRYIHLGHRYRILYVNDFNDSISIRDIETNNEPGSYSLIFFDKVPFLNKNVKVL